MARCTLCDNELVDGQCRTPGCKANPASMGSGPAGGNTDRTTQLGSETGVALLGPDRAVIDTDLAVVRRVWESRRKANGATTEIVTLCGFPTAGKSWTAERIIAEMEERVWHVARDPRSPKPSTRGLMIGTLILGQTFELLVHSIGKADGSRPIDLIDVPGEFFRNAIPQDDADSIVNIPYSLIAAIALSDKVIFALPADAIVFGTLISSELRSIGNARRKNSAADKIEQRDLEELGTRREQLVLQMEALEEEGKHNSPEYSKLKEQLVTVSQDLFETQMYSQEANNRLFTLFMERVLGRAAFLVHALTREKLFDTPPERWFDEFDGVAARDLPKLNVFCMAALTKADRVLPLCTDTYGSLAYCNDWERLPERQHFLDRLNKAGWTRTLRSLLRDPRMLMARMSPNLVSKFDRWMQVTQYEWVSADWQGDGWSNVFDKSHDHAGIVQLVNWLTMSARRPDPRDPILRDLDRLRAGAEGRTYEERDAV